MSWSQRREGWSDDRVAAEYDAHRFRTPLQRRKHANDAAVVRGLLERVGSELAVLDAPTGTGRMLADLERAGHRPTGLDLSAPMLREAGRASDAPRVCGEIERLPFRDGAFDAVIALRFLFHVREPEARARLLREYARTARWLVVHERSRANVKHVGRWLRSRFGLARRYRPAPSARDLADELGASGWEVAAVRPVSRLFSDKVLVLARRR